MAFVNVPGRFYTDPVVWHEGTIRRVHGPTSGTYNHEIDYRPGTIGPVVFHEAYDANGRFGEAFGGPYPGSDATACVWGKIVRGLTIDNRLWGGTCPGDDDGASTDHGSLHGSTFETSTAAESFAPDSSSATVAIGGYLLRPWMLPTFDNPWMDDDDLEAEYLAAESAASAALPGSGWFLEWEQFYPTFDLLEVAPDETITGTLGPRTEGVTWLYDPPSGRYAFYGIDGSSNGIWGSGLGPDGTQLVRYTGGESDWLTVPEWQPTQDTSEVFFGGGFEVPEDENAASIALTTVCDTILGGYPGDNASGGRDNQFLLARSSWTASRFRFYRESSVIPPRRIFGRSDGATHGAGRVLGGGNTVQSGTRALGGIL